MYDSCCHDWTDVQAADIGDFHQMAVAGAERDDSYQPFTQLDRLTVRMCCAVPSVWRALLALMRAATRLRCVSRLSNTDPLSISALVYLPSLTTLSGKCHWAPTFAAISQQRSLHSRRQYRFLASPEVRAEAQGWPLHGTLLVLSRDEENGMPTSAVLLRPAAGLFAAYQRSLSDHIQAVLARWAEGDFRAGDERLSAAEGSAVEEVGPMPGHQYCSHATSFCVLLV